jgi:magnesium transporter
MEVVEAVDADRIRALRERGEPFWLRLTDPADGDLHRVGQLLPIHPMAIENSQEFGQRAKFDAYPHGALLVFYGAESGTGDRPTLVEVHLHVTDDALVTVTRQPMAALQAAGRRVAAIDPGHVGRAVHGVLDELADRLLNTLDGFDGTIDDLQASVAEDATRAKRQHIFALRRQLTELRQVVVPQRELLDPAGDLFATLGGTLTDDDRVGFRDVHDHLDRAAGLIGSYREQLGGVLDLYLTEVSNRMNQVMKRLTIVATVFLPLTFLTAFFGMNFGWFVQQISPMWTFWVFGIALAAAATAGLAVYLTRAGRG